MKTTIKIHDTSWFQEQCKVVATSDTAEAYLPKYQSWTRLFAVSWVRATDITSSMCMSSLEGKVLEAVSDSGKSSGDIRDARYMFGGYWIPNWAIEWVKEEY